MIRDIGRKWQRIVLMCLVAVTVGCGNGVELGIVQGTITKDGEPADSILVNFMPDPDAQTPGAMSTAITDDQGRYELKYQGEIKEPGAAVGVHRVVLNDLVPENHRGNGPPPKSRVRPDWMIAGQTPFRFEVAPGEQTIDITLDE